MNFNGLMKFDFSNLSAIIAGVQYQKSGRIDYFAKVLRFNHCPLKPLDTLNSGLVPQSFS